MRFLTADQQQRVNVFEELRQMASDDATFLSSVITDDPVQWKSPNSPTPKVVSQVKCKVKGMLIIFFDIKGTVHK
jgi:hypothetical protein